MLNIALLGCGRIGQVHARSLARIEGARVAAVCDAVPEAAAALAATTGAEAMDADAVLARPGLDAVVIGTPTDTHFDLIHAAAAAGLAIFCEKPVDLDATRITACARAVADAGVPFLTAFNRRFDPSFADLRARLHAGEIGDPEIVTITSRDPSPPPLSYIAGSGGLFRDMMIHDLDMARWLLDEEPVRVQATGAALVDPEIGAAGDVDTAAVMLTTASGRIAQIGCSRRATYGYDQRIEVHGSLGMLRAGNRLETTVEAAGPAGFRRAPAQHFFLERYADAYLAEMRAFVDALRTGTPPTPSIADGLRAQVLADAADTACREGRVVVLDDG
ncbi:inositol 2-dehydrogenase [uncultured Jannaschia sp.]|uniref:inositol 2-dehydrogenase n=1 Tax=uncultured Jannaschia sp. TaxID=293347 RepID=UPI00260670FF|nr:inositol 2-dehydrogenase [uncultured Jannaschia sp.]